MMTWLLNWLIVVKNNMNSKAVVAILISIVAIVGIGILVTSQKPVARYKNLDEFAQCIASKKIAMYGAAWCSHCQAQKKLFGESFKYVPYVECPENTQKCIDAGVESYPTWISPDGKKITGEQSLEDISKFSQCPLR